MHHQDYTQLFDQLLNKALDQQAIAQGRFTGIPLEITKGTKVRLKPLKQGTVLQRAVHSCDQHQQVHARLLRQAAANFLRVGKAVSQKVRA